MSQSFRNVKLAHVLHDNKEVRLSYNYCGGSGNYGRRLPSIKDVVDIFHFSLQVKLALFSLVVDNMAQSHLKFTPPRALTNEETQLTMTRWKINFKQYMKRDPSYITFLNMEWVPTAENYNLQEETEGLKRSPEALKDDLLDFLHILCSYLPHGYLTDRIISKSTSLLSAFRIIDESFNLLPNQESFFEFKGLKKMSSETYRQMFDRMVAFSSQHLMPARTPQVDVDGVLVPDGGDALTVSHLNLIELLWLDKLSPDLLNIVRTEYAKELRDNEPLAGLVPRISQNVDHLLLKYEKPPATHGATVNLVHEQVSEQAALRRHQLQSRRRAVPEEGCHRHAAGGRGRRLRRHGRC